MKYRPYAGVLLSLLVGTFFLTKPVSAEAPLASPMLLYADLIRVLPQLGVSALPIDYSAPGLPGGRINLLRGKVIAGQVEYTQDIEKDSADFNVYDSQNRRIAWASQRWIDGHPGRCLEVSFSTLHGESAGFPPAFEVRKEPGGDLYYLQYGRPSEPLFWQRDLAQSVKWLHAVIASAPGVAIRSGDPQEAMYLALAANPTIAPYLSDLRMVMIRGRVHIQGTVPSTPVYNLIALAAIDARVPGFDLDLVIFTPRSDLSRGYPTDPSGGLLFPGNF